MKIWMIGQYPPQAGGISSHVEELSRRLSQNHEVTVITYGRKGRKHPGKVRIVEIPAPNIGILRGVSFFIGTVLKLHSLSKSGKADVIHAHFMHPPGTAAALYMKLFGKGERLIITAHGSDILCLGKGRMGRALVKFACGRCDSVICVSDYLATEAAALGIKKSKIRVVRNGIDAKSLPREKKEKLRKCLGLPDAKIVAFCGRLSAAKGADIFMVLAEHLAWRDRKVKFLIVGSGPDEDRMKKHAKERLPGRVIFTGGKSRGEALRYVKASDVLVVPSRIEGFGLCALEASAMGVPVVAYKSCALPEVLSPLSLTDNLPATVMRILHVPAFRKEVIEKNKKRAEAFTLERMARETQNAYAKKRHS